MDGVGKQATMVTNTQQFVDDFEPPDRDWFFGGGAGFDFNKGLAHQGQNNAWVRQSHGWNAINRFWTVGAADAECQAQAWLRLSPTLTDGYFSVRGVAGDDNGDGPILNEIKLVGPGADNPSEKGYNRYNIEFNSGPYRRLLFYIGLWGVGPDAWIQIDDFALQARYET